MKRKKNIFSVEVMQSVVYPGTSSPPAKKTPGIKPRSESSEQIILMARLRQFHPDILVMSIPNGGKRDPRTAATLKKEGVLAGAPDILVAEARNGKHALFVEMKRQDGSTSDRQDEVHAKLKERGYEVQVHYSCDEAYKAILKYVYGDRMTERFPHLRMLMK